MEAAEQFAVTVTVDGHTIHLLERSIQEDEKIFRLSVDRNRAVFLSLPRWYSPGLSYHGGRLAIWSGRKLCFYNCETGDLASFDMDDEVHAVYAVGDRWCLVCELSLVLFDERLGQEAAAYRHGEEAMALPGIDPDLELLRNSHQVLGGAPCLRGEGCLQARGRRPRPR